MQAALALHSEIRRTSRVRVANADRGATGRDHQRTITAGPGRGPGAFPLRSNRLAPTTRTQPPSSGCPAGSWPGGSGCHGRRFRTSAARLPAASIEGSIERANSRGPADRRLSALPRHRLQVRSAGPGWCACRHLECRGADGRARMWQRAARRIVSDQESVQGRVDPLAALHLGVANPASNFRSMGKRSCEGVGGGSGCRLPPAARARAQRRRSR